ncbi:MAG: DUF4416 family protein [Pirellulales bacterium]|nr:DUF4416 family protein [Pirellulales bacterium]
MGHPHPHPPVLRILAAFSRYEAALDWGREQAVAAWGAVALEGPRFEFAETDYYAPSMGPGLWKTLWAFEPLAPPEELPAWKHQTNAWESTYASWQRHPEARPLNLDPGYVTAAKLVLASTKDHAHRLYLGQGIFGEVTLHVRDRRWQPQAWTYADYRRADVQEFLETCRQYYRQRQQGLRPSEGPGA